MKRRSRPTSRACGRPGRALGPVRDLDVFWKKAQAYIAREDTASHLGPLATAWETARQHAREEMLAHLGQRGLRGLQNANSRRCWLRRCPSEIG